MIVVRGVNLETRQAWDQSEHPTRAEATMAVGKLRAKRGPWKDDPVVYGISKDSTEEVTP